MARFYGEVGYVTEVEGAADVIIEEPVERKYKGSIERNSRRLSDGMSINDTVMVSNSISIVADPYALSHFHSIRYVRWGGVCWKVDNVEVQYPRLLLTLGGVYNGKTENSSE